MVELRCAVLVAVLFGGCGSGGGALTGTAQLSVLAPASDVEFAEGADVDVEVRVTNGFGPGSTTDLVAVEVDGTELPIATDLPAGANTVQWNLAAVAPGFYRVEARAVEGTAVAAGRVRVNAAPSLGVTFPPAGGLSAGRGAVVPVRFRADDPDDDATVEVFADRDGDLATTGDQFLAATVTDADGGFQEAAWDAAAAPFGTYAIVVRLTGPLHPPVTATAPGAVVLGNAAFARSVANNAEVSDVAVFADGSFAVAGTHRNALVLGAGEANETTLPGAEFPFFVARYEADGTLRWARGAPRVTFVRLAAGPDGTLSVTGQFADTVTLGAGEAGETTLRGPGGTTLVARYRADGTLAWARRVVVFSLFFDPFRIASGPDGCTVLAGNFSHTALFGEGEANETLLRTAVPNDFDAFLACFGPDGDFRWARQVDGNGQLFVADLEVPPGGGCVFTGNFDLEIRFSDEDVLVSRGQRDMYVARLDADGELVFATAVGGVGHENAGQVAVRPDGSCAVAGVFDFETRIVTESGPVVLEGPDLGVPFLATVSPVGVIERVTRLADRSLNAARPGLFFGGTLVFRLHAHADGGLLFTSIFWNDAVVAPEDAAVPVTEAGYLALRLDAAGSVAWVRTLPRDDPNSLPQSATATFPDGSSLFAVHAGEGAVEPGGAALTGAWSIVRLNPDGDP